MTEHVTRTGTGLIGWFDILGYRQILAQNEAETVFKLLADTIAGIPAAIVQSFQPREHSQETPEGTSAAEIGREFDWLPFSDTVLVTLPCARSFEPVDRACRFFAFTHACKILVNGMFVRGVPVRGAIHFGEYLIGRLERIPGRCFAGKGVAEAEQQVSNQDWSGCILSKQAEEEKIAIVSCVEDKSWDASYAKLLIRYEVPLKGGSSEERLTLNWLFPNFKPKQLVDGQTVRAIVTASFVSHGKVVTPQALSKVNNTEFFLCFCQAEHERYFGLKPAK